MEKYCLWDHDDNLVFTCDKTVTFNITIEINYPLGNFVHIYDLPEWTTIVFENYKITVNK